MTAAGRDALALARAALRAGDPATARCWLESATDAPRGDVIEGLALASYLELDYPAAIEGWEGAYAAHRGAGDRLGALRVARILSYMYYAIVGDVAVSGGWLARAQTLLAGGCVANFFRKPYGPGWMLIGDAGYTKDPITAQGITDAFRDADGCSTALDDVLAGVRTFDAAMAEYHHTRDAAALPMYGFTTELATLEPPPAQLRQLLAALRGNQDAIDGFVSVVAGTVSPAEFFDPVNVGQIFAAAQGGHAMSGAAG